MISNIDILYIIGNDFSPWLKVWDHSQKMRPRLARLHCQRFDSLSRNTCFEIRPLSSRRKGTVTIVRSKATFWDHELTVGMADTADRRHFSSAISRATSIVVGSISMAKKLSSPPTGVLWSSSYRTCKKLRPRALWSRRGREGYKESVCVCFSERKWEGKREKRLG